MKPLRLLFYRSLVIPAMSLVLCDTRSLAGTQNPTNADITRALTEDLNSGAHTNVLIRFEVKKVQATVSGHSQALSLLVLYECQQYYDGVHTMRRLEPLKLIKKDGKWVNSLGHTAEDIRDARAGIVARPAQEIAEKSLVQEGGKWVNSFGEEIQTLAEYKKFLGDKWVNSLGEDIQTPADYKTFSEHAVAVNIAAPEDNNPIIWQFSTTECVRLSIREKEGYLGSYEATFHVIDPKKREYTRTITVHGDASEDLIFPDDFERANLYFESGVYQWFATVGEKKVVSDQFERIAKSGYRGINIPNIVPSFKVIAAPTPKTSSKSWDAPHIYLHIADESQREVAMKLRERLRKSGAGYVVAPEIQNVSGKEGVPTEASEVRYFTPTDSSEAQRIAKEVAPFFGSGGITADYPEGMPYVSHARQYEIWFSSAFHEQK